MRASATQLVAALAVIGVYATYQNRVKLFYVDGKSYFTGRAEPYSYSLDSGILPSKYVFDKDGYYLGDRFPESAKDLAYKDHTVKIIDRLERTSQSIDENNGKFTFTGEQKVEVVDTVLAEMSLKEFVERHPHRPGQVLYPPTNFTSGPMSTKSDWKYGTYKTKRRWVMQFTDPVTGSMEENAQYLGTGIWARNTQSYPPTSMNHGGWKN